MCLLASALFFALQWCVAQRRTRWWFIPIRFCWFRRLATIHPLSSPLSSCYCFSLLFTKKSSEWSILRKIYCFKDTHWEKQQQLSEQNKALALSQETKLALQIAEERNRIARDIHDNVRPSTFECHFTNWCAWNDQSEPKLNVPLANLSATVHTGMDRIRQSVLISMKHRFLSASHRISDCWFPSSITIEGNLFEGLSEAQQNCFLMVIKEALTNSIKHSHAKTVVVHFARCRLYRLNHQRGRQFTPNCKQRNRSENDASTGPGAARSSSYFARKPTLSVDDHFTKGGNTNDYCSHYWWWPVWTTSLQTILESTEEIQVLGIGHCAKDAIALLRSHRPDVVLTDIRMPELGSLPKKYWLNFRKRSSCFWPPSKIRIHSWNLSIGVKGYLIKQNLQAIIPSVKAAYNGQVVFGNEIVETFTQMMKNQPAIDNQASFSERELAIIKEAAGKNNKEIADALYLSDGTIRNYISQLLEKLGAGSHAISDLLLSAFKVNLIDCKSLKNAKLHSSGFCSIWLSDCRSFWWTSYGFPGLPGFVGLFGVLGGKSAPYLTFF